MKLEIFNPFTDQKWLDFISSMPNANIFHHPNWLQVLKEQYNFNVFIISNVDDRKRILAGMPFCELRSISGGRSWSSLPFSDYCNPLYNNPEDIKVIEEFLIENVSSGKIKEVEVRGNLCQSSEFISQSDFFIHKTELNRDIEKLFSSFKKTQIQQPIRKAERNGVRHLVSNSKEQIEEFYSLHLKTRKKLGVPIQPKNFFYKIYYNLIKKNLGFVVVTYKDDKPIGTGLFLGFGNTLTYKFSASDPEQLKLRPNHLMLWTAIQEGIKREYKYFDFGRTEKDNDGLRKFKAGWGSEEKCLTYNFYPSMPQHEYTKAIKDKIVAPIIRNSPQFFCRVIGEVAYKFFPSL